MGDVRRKFMNPLLVVFSGPDKTDLDAWLKVYQTILSPFDDETLARAADKIIATRMLRSFPLPAECKEACRHARPKIHAKPCPWD